MAGKSSALLFVLALLAALCLAQRALAADSSAEGDAVSVEGCESDVPEIQLIDACDEPLSAAAPAANNFLNAIKARRTIYALGNKLPISQDKVVEIVKEAVKQSPSSFNSQSSRVVILFGDHSKKVWNITKDQLKKIVPAEAFPATESKLDSFAAGSGTILFYEDQAVIEGLQKAFALYADNFPIWSEHSTGIAQFAVWTALAQEQVGASLQHYNPLIDADLAKEFEIPATWKLRAQMPFGSIEAAAGNKDFVDDEARFKIFQ